MDPAAPKPPTTTNSSLAKVFLPGSEAKEQDWKKHTYTEMLASPTHDVQVMLTQDNRVMLISHDKIVAYAPKKADILLDHVEVIGPKIAGQQQELSVACLIKKPNSQEYDFEVAKLRTNKIDECVHKASAGGVDIPQYLGNQVVAIMFDSGHYVGFDMSLNTATPKQRPDILPFHDENHIYVQKIHKFGANASFCLGQFEGHYYRFYDLQLKKWSTVGFNLPFDIGYIMRAILVGTPNSGHLIIDSGAKILLIKVGMNCEIIQEIPFEDITGKKLPDNHFPIVTYFRIYKGKYLLSIIDSTNLWVLPLVKDAKHPKGKHYNLKGTVEVPEKKTENDDQNTFQFIRWDSNPGHVIVLDKQKLVTVKIDKLVEDFPDFATPIREEDFDVKSDKLEVTKIKPKALKSVAPMKATAESPVMKEFPYPEALEQKQTRSVAFPEEEFGQNSSLAQTNYRSTISKSQHKLTWSAPNPYAEQYEQKPWHAYEEEEAAIITSMEYKRKVQAEARKKKPFQVLGIHHPPKKSYNSLGDQHLAMFFSKPDVMKHLLKQKLVTKEGVIVKNPETLLRQQSQKRFKKSSDDGEQSSGHKSSKISKKDSSSVLPPLQQTNTRNMSTLSKGRLKSGHTDAARDTYGQGFRTTAQLPKVFRDDVLPIEQLVQKTEREAHMFEEDGFGVRRYRLPKQEFQGFLHDVQALVADEETA